MSTRLSGRRLPPARKGVDGGPGAQPYHVDAVFQRFEHVLGIGYFGRHFHTGFSSLTRLSQPGSPSVPTPLKSIGAGAGLPDAGAKQVHLLPGQLAGGVQTCSSVSAPQGRR